MLWCRLAGTKLRPPHPPTKTFKYAHAQPAAVFKNWAENTGVCGCECVQLEGGRLQWWRWHFTDGGLYLETGHRTDRVRRAHGSTLDHDSPNTRSRPLTKRRSQPNNRTLAPKPPIGIECTLHTHTHTHTLQRKKCAPFAAKPGKASCFIDSRLSRSVKSIEAYLATSSNYN